MIVADTSVWIDFLNGVRSPEALLLRSMLGEQPVVVGDLVRGASGRRDGA